MSYSLVKVWSISTYCGGSQTSDPHPPAVTARVDEPRVVTARIEDGRLHLRAGAAGSTRVLLRTRGEVDCEMIYDATHFTVTVARSGRTAAP